MNEPKVINLDGKRYFLVDPDEYHKLKEGALDRSKFIPIEREQLAKAISLVNSLPYSQNRTPIVSAPRKVTEEHSPERMEARNNRRARLLMNFRRRFGERKCEVCTTTYTPRLESSKYCTRRCAAIATSDKRLETMRRNGTSSSPSTTNA